MKDLEKKISIWEQILNNEEALKHVMKRELQNIKKEYVTPRLTEIKEEITEIKIDTQAMIPKEDVIVLVTKDGYIKRTSSRSYAASTEEDLTIKENDYVLGIYEMNTTDTLLLITNNGNYLHIPVHIIPDLKWKEMPKHVSNVIELPPGDEIVSSIPAYDFETDKNIIITTKLGMIKRSKIKEFKLQRYNKATCCMKLKDDDQVINAYVEEKDTVFLTTNTGYGLAFKTEEIPVVGVKASGVKAMKLKNDYIVSSNNFSYTTDEFIAIITEKGTGKRVRLQEFELSTRARRGLLLLREVKSNPYRILKTFISDNRSFIGLKNGDINTIKITELSIADRYSTGTQVSKHSLTDAFVVANLMSNKRIENEEETVEQEEVIPKKEQISLAEIDDRLMTIDDFLK